MHNYRGRHFLTATEIFEFLLRNVDRVELKESVCWVKWWNPRKLAINPNQCGGRASKYGMNVWSVAHRDGSEVQEEGGLVVIVFKMAWG